ncbi:respiratory nitrate reductase subunit gamma [Geomonas azotofigens]|uniref:respiratory nitrate reductase subunit gamma n=1 Tax=Geomonas azotofigens TaxID=2843196 RepID=UPI001C11C4E7|nr:respiratory nitrate reductase subunit gamma [Geomonas azotofigens]MBU5613852.1 respiratory nitrate reductase subunit gamma [Geomonas azotofigens]
MDKFAYFWSLIIVGGTVFLMGAYRNVFLKLCFIRWINRKIREEGGAKVERLENTPIPEPATIVREAVFQKRIRNRSVFLWLRHCLIFFGFTAIFALDCIYTVFGHYFHHYFDYTYFTSGAGRAFLKAGMELSGAVLLVGLTAALVHRVVYAERERTLVNLNLVLLLWVVTLTGFLTEACRLIGEPDDPFVDCSFVAGPLASALRGIDAPWHALATPIWILHATVTVAFFAYLPFSRFVHIIAAPIGRSITQDGNYGRLKRERVTEGLL